MQILITSMCELDLSKKPQLGKFWHQFPLETPK